MVDETFRTTTFAKFRSFSIQSGGNCPPKKNDSISGFSPRTTYVHVQDVHIVKEWQSPSREEVSMDGSNPGAFRRDLGELAAFTNFLVF